MTHSKNISNSQLRRLDRGVEDQAWISAFLKAKSVGILATSDENQPFINSNLFAYDEADHAIYIHTGRLGRTRSNIEKNPRVCFHVFELGRFLPADKALEFSVEYAGVTIFGQIQILEKASGKERALQLILDKYAPHLKPGKDYRSITPDELKRTAVFKLIIREWSAKKKIVASDFPQAFHFPEETFLQPENSPLDTGKSGLDRAP